MKTYLGIALLALAGVVWGQPPDTMWTRTFGMAEDESIYNIHKTSDGGSIVAGSGRLDIAWEPESGFLLKLFEDGRIDWMREYRTTYGFSNLRYVIQTSDNGYFAAGRADVTRVKAIKTDSIGHVEWVFVTPYYGAAFLDVVCLETSTHDFILLQSGSNSDLPDIHAFCLTSMGDTLWTNSYGDSSTDRARFITETNEGFTISGSSDVRDTAGTLWITPYILRIDQMGSEVSQHYYLTGNNDWIFAADCDGTGGYFLSGLSYLSGELLPSRFCMRVLSIGDTAWTRRFIDMGYGDSFAGCTFPDSTYVLFSLFGRNPFLISVDIDGILQWNMEYPLSDSVFITTADLSSTGHTYLGGVSFPASGDIDILVAKLAPLLSTDSQLRQVRGSIPRIYAYPNPFNAATTFSFSLPHASPVSLTIFNVLGQAVYQVDLGRLNAGEHRHWFDASELPSGVYIARVQAGEHSQMRKMVLLR